MEEGGLFNMFQTLVLRAVTHMLGGASRTKMQETRQFSHKTSQKRVVYKMRLLSYICVLLASRTQM